MTSKGEPSRKADRLSELERAAKEAREHEADAEREADDTLGRAEELERKSEDLGRAGEQIRRKASDPVGFPPPGIKEKKSK